MNARPPADADRALRADRRSAVRGGLDREPLVPEEVVRYLLDIDRLTPRDIVQGEVSVEPISARNRSFRVAVRDAPGLFLKQAEPRDAGAAENLAREAGFYARVAGTESLASLRALLPAFVAYDEARALLTIELVAEACNAHDLDDADGPAQFPRIGALLGEALARVHAVRADDAQARDASDRDAKAGAAHNRDALGLESLAPPWVLDLCRPVPAMLRDLSAAHLALVKQLQAAPGASEALDALRDAWAPTTLVHRDLKWGNVLVRARAPHFVPERLWLIDWEDASWGDPAWDVGSAFHSCIADAIHAAMAEHDEADGDAPAPAGALRDGSPAAMREAFQRAFPRVQAELVACWSAYADALGLTPESALELRARAVRSAGARLLQSSYEWCHSSWFPPRGAVLAFQLGLNLLRAPLTDAERFLGLATGTEAR